MSALDACQIALVAPGAESSARARVELLRNAGASVRLCQPGQDLWSALSEAAFDLVLILAERGEAAAFVLYKQIKEDARARGALVLLMTPQPAHAAERGALVMSAGLLGESFVSAVRDAVAPARRLREAQQQERALREQLSAETGYATASRRQLGELGHELRAMLDAMLGFACNLRDELPGPLLPEQRTHVAGILDAVARAAKLLDKAKSTSLGSMPRVAVTSASVPPRGQRTLVQLGGIASEVVALFEAVAARRSQRLSCDCDESVCVWGDALKLKQVVTNLVVNALKYTPEGGEIAVFVGWSSPNDTLGVKARRAGEIVVSDNGPGIAREYRERIFARGFRIESDASVPGQGLGLAVVREIVTQHGGSIAVEGEPGAGAIFRVLLPQDRRLRTRSGELDGAGA